MARLYFFLSTRFTIHNAQFTMHNAILTLQTFPSFNPLTL